MNQSSTDASELKKQAAEQAVDFVRPGMVVGLGTGSTANYAVEAIGRKLRLGELKDIVGIPTSERTRERAQHADIALTTLDEHPIVDLTIDGADQVDADGNLLKGKLLLNYLGESFSCLVLVSPSQKLFLKVD